MEDASGHKGFGVSACVLCHICREVSSTPSSRLPYNVKRTGGGVLLWMLVTLSLSLLFCIYYYLALGGGTPLCQHAGHDTARGGTNCSLFDTPIYMYTHVFIYVFVITARAAFHVHHLGARVPGDSTHRCAE